MKATGIKRNGEKIELEYSSEVELEFLTCRHQIVSVVREDENKKSVKAPVNRQVKTENLVRR